MQFTAAGKDQLSLCKSVVETANTDRQSGLLHARKDLPQVPEGDMSKCWHMCSCRWMGLGKGFSKFGNSIENPCQRAAAAALALN